jgi:hypothetical protein
MTTPGFACGVRVILSSFLSYAVYDVRRGTADCGGGADGNGCDCNCGSENAEFAAGVEMYDGGGAAAGADAVFEPKSPRISSTVERCDGGGETADVDEGVDCGVDEPKISARS